MAALCPGRQYGLSSQESFGANKDLIFVKLTDSALKTIEEYVRNQSKLTKSPTIKFLGNEGQLSFPSQHHNGSTSFNFSLSSTTDMEGPGGSFECVQQSGRGSLAALGPVSHKLRIHANDDVYETTRHRMSVAEENHKNKCVREIKMNQTDIGRKVKVKQMPGRSVPPPPREMSMRDAIMKPSPYQPAVNMPSKPPQPPPHGLNGLSNGLGSNQVSSSKPQNKPSMPDIAKRPIKERMIHLLALRPFKKPELYERLIKEGLREKNAMTSVLKQIACLRDNSYHLNRAMWNDVHEDWPFYTDSERQMLKRRKPQNLTPPGSSDGGSSGSGHSPTSTHPGSPPPPVSASVPSKRPGYFNGVDGLPTKRPRVSHFQKPSEQQPQAGYRPPAENNTQRRPMTDSRDASNMNPRSRESPTTNGYHGHVHNYHEKRTNSDDEDHTTTTTTTTTTTNSRKREKMETPPPPQVKHVEESKRNKEVLVDRTSVTNGVLLNGNRAKQEEKKDRHHGRVSSSTQNKIARVSPDSQSDRIVAPPPTDEFPDYVKVYTAIRDMEQRKRYKAEFNANYAEYRHLHGVVEKVSQRFTELEERLKQEDQSSPRYKDIKKQIVKEYQQNKQDKEHQKAKRRFQYLHEKLSHIKRLVCEYDQEVLQESQY